MINGKISNYSKDEIKDSNLQAALDWLGNISESGEGLDLGKIEITDSIFAIVSEYKTSPVEAGKYEAHKKYIDIQVLISGREKVLVAPLAELKVTDPYIEENDCELYKYDSSISSEEVILDGSNFTILFPEDAHMPGRNFEGEEEVKKIVIKVPVFM
jgi:YhcH/YjgK/YiaL family protein